MNPGKKYLGIVAAAGLAAAAHAATRIKVQTLVVLNGGISGDKPKSLVAFKQTDCG